MANAVNLNLQQAKQYELTCSNQAISIFSSDVLKVTPFGIDHAHVPLRAPYGGSGVFKPPKGGADFITNVQIENVYPALGIRNARNQQDASDRASATYVNRFVLRTYDLVNVSNGFTTLQSLDSISLALEREYSEEENSHVHAQDGEIFSKDHAINTASKKNIVRTHLQMDWSNELGLALPISQAPFTPLSIEFKVTKWENMVRVEPLHPHDTTEYEVYPKDQPNAIEPTLEGTIFYDAYTASACEMDMRKNNPEGHEYVWIVPTLYDGPRVTNRNSGTDVNIDLQTPALIRSLSVITRIAIYEKIEFYRFGTFDASKTTPVVKSDVSGNGGVNLASTVGEGHTAGNKAAKRLARGVNHTGLSVVLQSSVSNRGQCVGELYGALSERISICCVLEGVPFKVASVLEYDTFLVMLSQQIMFLFESSFITLVRGS